MFSILHIDNNFFYKEILHNLSVERDLQYFSAKNPEMAYEIIETHDIDMIVTGLEFEGESEERFIRKLILVKDISTPIVVLSAVEDEKLKRELLEMGVTEFITKNNLLEFLNTLLIRLESSNFIDAKLKTLHLAILDDNETHLRQMKNMFTRYSIVNVDYYNESPKLLESDEEYDIYLVDCIIPEISGQQVIAELRKHNEYAVIIAISSLSSHSVISNILMTGADDFINKPFSENILMARLKANVRTYILMEQLKEKNNRLGKLVKEDGLTGLYNRNFIVEILKNEIARAKRYDLPLSVLMFDIDKFKSINDTFGHHIGDEVLIAIGKLWHDDSRKIDIAGRYGGDEFVVVLPETDLIGAMLYAERIRKDISSMKFSKTDVKTSISGGIAEYSGQDALELIKEADKYLYKSKENGRNRISNKENV